ncbi:CoA transferase [Microbacterium sp. A94]|uniref:CoA transferase n=1 Tax=Microbacterium sp. A94 TaxID=3450717 RepID=UPI003F42C9B1
MRVLEFPAMGPAPEATRILAGLGASVTSILRPGPPDLNDPGAHSRHVYTRLDLRSVEGIRAAGELISTHDVVIEGFRPGVMERLGLGPAAVLGDGAPRVFARLSGWGRKGGQAETAGHDVNYLALTGTLGAMQDPLSAPVVPLNVVADGGAATLLAVGVLAALYATRGDRRPRLVDTSIVDGALQASALIWRLRGAGAWAPTPRSNELDGGAPYYNLYECLDGRQMAVGALEPKFYSQLLAVLQLNPDDLPDRDDRSQWPALREALATRIRTRTQAEWGQLSRGTDACFTPVLDFDEAASDAQLTDNDCFVGAGGSETPRGVPSVRVWHPSQRNDEAADASMRG